MNRRQKIIVSVVGIFIVLLALVGITYGYFLTRIQGNTNTTSITVTTADLKLVYEDGNGDISPSETIVPNTTIDEKNFKVTNSGNATVSNFNIYLENVVNELNRKEDLIYTITCEDTTTGEACDSDFVITNTNLTEDDELIFPSVNGTIAKDTLAVNESHTYRIVVKYKEAGVDQSEDMDKRINAKVNIYDTNGLTKLTLGNYILSNGALVQEVKEETQLIPECVKALGEEECANQNAYETVTTLMDPVYDNTITEIDVENIVDVSKWEIKTSDGINIEDSGLFVTEDDYGDSYFFRGTVQNNYVNFAGFTWRIVRINGDGSVRLILDGTLDTVKREGESTVAGTTSIFNTPPNDNAYVGYMYGLATAIPDETNWTDKGRCLVVENDILFDRAETTDGYQNGFTTQAECERNGGHWVTNEHQATHINIKESEIKKNVDRFYETYIQNESKGYNYQQYLSNTLFCGDKTTGVGPGVGQYFTVYALMYKLIDISAGSNSYINFKCGWQNSYGNNKLYSMYTSSIDLPSNSDLEVNEDLKYPIGLLTGEELAFAGGSFNEANTRFYLYNSKDQIGFWTMSPSYYNGIKMDASHTNTSLAEVASLTGDGYMYNGYTAETKGVRPVININDKVMVEKGDGTSDAPYILKLAS